MWRPDPSAKPAAWPTLTVFLPSVWRPDPSARPTASLTLTVFLPSVKRPFVRSVVRSALRSDWRSDLRAVLHRARRPVLCLAVGMALAAQARADEVAYRYSAPISVQKSAAFVRLALPPSVYGHARQPDLRDLRVVDAGGQRVPFALLMPRADQDTSTEQQRDATLYPLPARPAPGAAWAMPVEVTVQGDRVSVVRRAGATPSAPGAGASARPGDRSAGWLFDLGERSPRDPPPDALLLAWSGPAEFSAAFALETSDDLRAWKPAAGGQVMALASPAGALTQPRVSLPAGAGRFARLVWLDAATAPVLSGAQVVSALRGSVALDPATSLVLTPLPPAKDAAALTFDLGGTLPITRIDLQLAAGTRVAPVRIEGRTGDGDAWRDLAGGVFYRLERDGVVSTSPPLALRASVRLLRVTADERAAPLDPATTRLVASVNLAGLVFAAQGQAPFRLLAGSAKAPPGALPIATLVPALDDERPRFGQATLGDWTEDAEATAREQADERRAALRPWLLWAVLLAGVAGLGAMVWRLTRKP